MIKGGKKDTGIQCDIGANSIRGHFAAIHFLHRNISRRKVYETISKQFRERVKTHEQQGES